MCASPIKCVCLYCSSLVICGGMVDVCHNIDMSDFSSGDGLGDSNGDGLN